MKESNMSSQTDSFYVNSATKNKPYSWDTQQARLGNLSVVKSRTKTYGYSLHNKFTGETAMWYKHKRDAIKKIEDLRNCPNTP